MESQDKAKKINKLRGVMMTNGLSLAQWAKRNGYKPITVQKAVVRHWGEPDPNYTGIKTQEILMKLKEEFPEAVNGMQEVGSRCS
jgi:lambda repressor-like predicted transcriptional regulator